MPQGDRRRKTVGTRRRKTSEQERVTQYPDDHLIAEDDEGLRNLLTGLEANENYAIAAASDVEGMSLKGAQAAGIASGIARPIMSMGQRASRSVGVDLGDPDATNRINQAVQGAVGRRTTQDLGATAGYWTNQARGVAQTAPLIVGLGAGGGVPALVTAFGSQSANEAYTEAIDAGLDNDAAFNRAAEAGLIEGGVTAAFSAVGAGGMESLATGIGRQQAKRTIAKNIAQRGAEGLSGILCAKAT